MFSNNIYNKIENNKVQVWFVMLNIYFMFVRST